MSFDIYSAVLGGIIAVLLTSGLSYLGNARATIFVLIAEFELNKKYKDKIEVMGISEDGFKTFCRNGGYRFISKGRFNEVLEYYFNWYVYGNLKLSPNTSDEYSNAKDYITGLDYDTMINKLKKEAKYHHIIFNYCMCLALQPQPHHL